MHLAKRLIVALPRLLGLCAILAGGAAAADVTVPDYKLHAGDKMEISVWKETEMQKTITVSPDGKFSFPLAGEMTALGKTIAQIRGEIEVKLKTYIPDPVVTVSITEVGGNVAYVIGQVGKAGAFIMNPTLSVLQALTLAGGPTPFAKTDGIIVIRNAGAAQRVMNFRYGQVSEGKNLDQNIQLESGDVVVVP